MKKRKSIRKSMLLMFVASLMFFCISFTIATYIMQSSTVEDYRMRRAETSANTGVSTINNSLENYNYLTRLLMVNSRVVDYLKADEINIDLIYEARHGIYEIQNLYSYIDSVYVFRNDGKYVSTGRIDYIVDMRGEEHQRILDAEGSTIVAINGNGMIKKSNGEQLLTMSRAVYDINSQKLIGMLIMNISSNYFEETMNVQSEDGMCILDSEGTILCGDERYGELYKKNNRLADIQYFKTRIDGEKKIVACKKAVSPMIIMCASGSVKGPFSLKKMMILIIPFGAFIISIIVCAGYITKNITRPIKELDSTMEKSMESNKFEKIEASMPENEIGNLTKTYNTLFDQLLITEKNIQKAEMRVLQEQIKPHFLYNTLETISYMAVLENADSVHDALETLGNFYRNFLSKGSREISLRRELSITKDYLALQKLRYGDIIQDEYDIDEEVLDCIIPKLILQPLVENAIYHGIRLKGEEGIIRISAQLVDSIVIIKVYDTGVGMSQEDIAVIWRNCEETENEGTNGFGLAGTINRIRYFCENKNAVQIRSELGEFTEIELRVSMKK